MHPAVAHMMGVELCVNPRLHRSPFVQVNFNDSHRPPCVNVELDCVCRVWACEHVCIQGHTADLQDVWAQLCCHGNWE